MDFRRIEMIFLVVFVALDIFLFASYHQSQNVVVNSNKSDITSIAQEMKSANIVSGKLSNKKQKGYYLAGRPNTKLIDKSNQIKAQDAIQSGNSLVVHLKDTIYIEDKDVKKVLDKYISNPNNVLLGTSYKYNPYLSNDKNYVYSQMTSYGEIFDDDAQVEFTKKNSSILMYKQTNINKISVLREEQDAISEKEAVEKLYTASEIPDNSKIVWTKYAYKKLLTAKGNSIYIPAWYVQIKNKSSETKTIKIVNAFNGTIMKNQ
ncbi:two-component system regulatory protein YycI [Companilactobacillus sp. DQM5]|uniref:two-component system regulatory protein YycI n=1 Tax=Companilactobacillus sp. DQM5 TaxID=3463359 RepID=UPI0040582AA7